MVSMCITKSIVSTFFLVIIFNNASSFVYAQSNQNSLLENLRLISERHNAQLEREYNAANRRDVNDFRLAQMGYQYAREDYNHALSLMSSTIETYITVGLIDSLKIGHLIVSTEMSNNIIELAEMYAYSAQQLSIRKNQLANKAGAIRYGINNPNILPFELSIKYFETMRDSVDDNYKEQFRIEFYQNEFVRRSHYTTDIVYYHFIGWEHANLKHENYRVAKGRMIRHNAERDRFNIMQEVNQISRSISEMTQEKNNITVELSALERNTHSENVSTTQNIEIRSKRLRIMELDLEINTAQRKVEQLRREADLIMRGMEIDIYYLQFNN